MPFFATRFTRLHESQKIVLTVHPPPKDAWDTLHGAYKYSLPKPYDQDKTDAVLHFMRKTIGELSKTEMSVAIVWFKIQGLTCHLPIWPLNYRNAQFPTKLYTIRKSYEEFPRCFSLWIEDRGSMNPVLTTDRVKAQLYPDPDGEGAMSLKDFLIKRAEPDQYMEGRVHPAFTNLVAQQKWWGMLGKTFPFNDLPKEIRLQVLLHALGEVIRPCAAHDQRLGADKITLYRKGWGNRGELYGFWKAEEDYPEPNRAVFQVSRQMRDEAWEAAWIGTEKHFDTDRALEKVLQCRIPFAPASTQWLAKVTLDLNLTEYFRLFGWTVDPVVQPYPGPHRLDTCSLLQRAPTIKELTLSFQNPYLNEDNPWSNWLDEPYDENRFFTLQILFPYGMRRSPCYRTIVDWILTFAFPYIKSIPLVRLRGCIKTWTKQKWNRILAIEYKKSQGKKVGEWEHHDFDYDTALNNILSQPASALPPVCTCPKCCYHDTYYEVPNAKSDEASKRIEALRLEFDRDDSFELQDLINACEKINEDFPSEYEWIPGSGIESVDENDSNTAMEDSND